MNDPQLRVEDGREQTGISRKLREADQEPEKEKPAEQSIPANERIADKKAIMDNIECCSGAPVRPWREASNETAPMLMTIVASTPARRPRSSKISSVFTTPVSRQIDGSNKTGTLHDHSPA